jgi:hypothetical protein
LGRRWIVLAVVGLAVGGSACSEPDGLPPGADVVVSQPQGVDALPADAGYDTCDLVPVEMVNRNLGLELPEGHRADDTTDTRSCQYGEYSFSGAGDVVVGVYVTDDSAQADSILEDIREQHDAFDVDGIGDEAIQAEFSDRFAVRQGNVVVDLYGTSGQVRLDTEPEELQALALEILDASAALPGAATTPGAGA